MHWRINGLSLVLFLGLASLVFLTALRPSTASDVAAWLEADLMPSIAAVFDRPIGAPQSDWGVETLLAAQRAGEIFGGWLREETADPRPSRQASRPASPSPSSSGPGQGSFALAGSPDRPLGASMANAVVASLSETAGPEESFDMDALLGSLRSALFGGSKQQDAHPAPETARAPLTLARVVDRPSEIKPLRSAARTGQPARSTTPMTLSRLVTQPQPRPGPARDAAAASDRADFKRQRVLTRSQRLRPFDAAALGIRTTPGSSADSLARILEDVSTRPPAARGYGPVLTGAQRSIPFERLLVGKPGLFTRD